MDDKSGQDKDNSMEAILLTTQLKEEVELDQKRRNFRDILVGYMSVYHVTKPIFAINTVF